MWDFALDFVSFAPNNLIFGIKYVTIKKMRGHKIKKMKEQIYKGISSLNNLETVGNSPSLDDRNKTIEKFGEAEFLRYLGKKYSIPVRNIEPTFQDQFDCFLRMYSKENILLMYFYRQVLQIRKMSQGVNVDFENYIFGLLKQLQKAGFPISDEEATSKYVIAVSKNFFDEKFDWKTFDRKNISPMGNESILNEISRESGQFHDRL